MSGPSDPRQPIMRMRSVDRFATPETVQPAAPVEVPNPFPHRGRHRFASTYTEEYVDECGRCRARLHYVTCVCGQRFVHRYEGPPDGPFAADPDEWLDAKAHAYQGRSSLATLPETASVCHVVRMCSP